jgi:hypothetical protein
VLVLRSLPADQLTPVVRQRKKVSGWKIFRGENIDDRDAQYDIFSGKNVKKRIVMVCFCHPKK